jgi:hypothetical protein
MLIIFLKEARHQWLTPVILATQEAEIRRIAVQSQSRQIVLKDPISKKKHIIKKYGGVVQGIGPEFKPQYHTLTQKEEGFKIFHKQWWASRGDFS